MNKWRPLSQQWQELSITTKFTAAFGLLLALILLVAISSYVALATVRRQTEAAILTSTEIQRLVLEMDRGLENARRLQRDFFLRYPEIGFSQARDIYALQAIQQIAQVVTLSTELKERIAQADVSDTLRERDVDLNLYLSSAERYADTFLEAVELVTTLAAEETGLQAQLTQHLTSLHDTLEVANDPTLIILCREMQSFAKDYLLTRQRPLLQSAFNVGFRLREAIKNSPTLEADQKAQALTYLDDYWATAEEIADLDVAIRSKFHDFDLQAESVDPISAELIALANAEVERARLEIEYASWLATVILAVTALSGLVLAGLVAVVLNNSITRNVIKLTETARELQAGNWEVQAQVDSADELGQLADTFNAMTTEIKAKVVELTELNQTLQVSERKFRKLFEDSHDTIAITTPDGWFVDINEAGVRLHGYSRAELMAQNAQTLYVNPEDRKQFRQRLEQDGTISNFETQLRRADGTAIDVVLNATVQRAEDGAVSGFQVIVHDITERKGAEEALQESERRYRLLTENVPTVVWVTSQDGRTIFISSNVEKAYGYSPDEILEEGDALWFGRIHPEDKDRVKDAFELLFSKQRQFDIEYRIQRKDGQWIWLHDRANIVEEKEGHLYAYGVFSDITERKQAEQEIRRRNRELALLNRVIAASAASTELKAILETTCRELALVFEVPQTAAFLLNEEKTEAVVVAEYLAEGRSLALNEVVPVAGNPLAEQLLLHKTPLIVPNAQPTGQDDPRLISVHDFLRRRGAGSLLIVPLIVEEEVVGCLGLGTTESHHYSAEEVDLVWSVAGQVAGSLARARLDQERQRLEAQYHQAQKMEAIGRLAGGVAHDFNNLLTAIMGYVGLTLYTLPLDDPVRQDIEGIQQTAERATNLTRQLLAFARKQVTHPTILNLNELILNVDKMLRRFIGEDIELVTLPAPDLGQVKADPGQLEQVLLNLAINARDAMPHGGKLTIETANVTLDDTYASHHAEVTAGQYVLLSVSDTGVGMTEEVKAHIFEPFFTTKERDKGTGLGLATCFGIVKQSGGHIWVYSEVGQGTTFKIYLPCLEDTVSPGPEQDKSDDLPRGTETVLLVEDEPSVRELAVRTLRQQGYQVLEAANGDEALRVFQEHAEEAIHLLLTDVVMPRLGGKELADRLKAMHPDIKVLFISGYTNNAIVHHGVLKPGITFLPKPFSPQMLAHKVREVLDR